jgi:nitroimidazol reductase NimA-like FMN-containing flavoprotein (pyridoxamine 5'-phosphate oxidase superfamily)
MAESFPVTDRTRVRRKAKRATYDRATLYAILDEALIASVAVVIDGQPQVQPMIHVRVGDDIILHGLATNRLLDALLGGAEACLNVTLVDALVLACRIEDHSFHYRSVTLYAKAAEVKDAGEKMALMGQVFASLVRSDRYASLPPLDAAYLKGTRVLRLPIGECVGKINDGHSDGTQDADPADGAAGIWSGIVPLALRAGTPIPDRRTAAEAIEPDGTIGNYGRERSA